VLQGRSAVDIGPRSSSPAVYQIGRLDEARREFETEKARFPESAVFMDRLLARLAGK
jgi:hypothetical protein